MDLVNGCNVMLALAVLANRYVVNVCVVSHFPFNVTVIKHFFQLF